MGKTQRLQQEYKAFTNSHLTEHQVIHIGVKIYACFIGMRAFKKKHEVYFIKKELILREIYQRRGCR